MQLVGKIKEETKGMGMGKGVAVCLAALLLSGCGAVQNLVTQVGEVNSWVDPTEPNIRPLGSPPLVKPILDTLDSKVEEPNDEFANATDVEPQDLLPISGDYRIGKNDLISVSIYDLLGEGTGETVKTVRVSETGSIALDFIKPVHAEGLTEAQLQDAIRQAYADAGQIRNARVSVEVAEERARTYSVWGNVGGVGQYQILQNDFRLLDALILAKGLGQSQGVEYCYVARRAPQEEPAAAATPTEAPSDQNAPPAPEDQNNNNTTTAPPAAPTTQLLQPPQSRANWKSQPPMMSAAGDAAGGAASEPASSGLLAPDNSAAPSGTVEGKDVAATAPATEPMQNMSGSATEPAMAGAAPATAPADMGTGAMTQTQPAEPSATGMTATGTTEPVAGGPMATEPVAGETTEQSGEPTTQVAGGAPGGLGGFKFNAPNAFERRVIRVPLKELLEGQLQYNIVIHPGDLIFVPDPVTGEFYMGGHVQRGGPYSLTARKIDLKQALISAGGFDQVAIPGRAEIIRRIGESKEVFVRVDLDKVFAGKQPDLYLKPNDVVYVGTNVIAPFLAAFRNAYRISYGFGFTYDQNFAPQQNTNP